MDLQRYIIFGYRISMQLSMTTRNRNMELYDYRTEFTDADLASDDGVNCVNPRCSTPGRFAVHPVTELCAGCIAQDLEDRLCRLQDELPDTELDNPESAAWRYIESRWDFLDSKGVEGIQQVIFNIEDGVTNTRVFETCEGRK
jgi:hypothetical protein